MVSPVPKFLRTENEIAVIDDRFIPHYCNLNVDAKNGKVISGSSVHKAKYAPGLATTLSELSGTHDLGDPMCGVGSLGYELSFPVKLNDIDTKMFKFLEPLKQRGCIVSYVPANKIEWSCECCLFSPPYYPRTDRKKPNAKNEIIRGPKVGFSDSYNCEHDDFIGNPGGAGAIKIYRDQMRDVYFHLGNICDKLIIVTKNWTRLGVELRLDLDTILICRETGWKCIGKYGFKPKPSLWSRYNAERGGGIQVEDVMIFIK